MIHFLQPISIPPPAPAQSDLAVGNHRLSPCPNVESSRVGSTVDTRQEKDKRWSMCALYHYCIPEISWLLHDRHISFVCLSIIWFLSVNLLPFASIWNVDDFAVPRQDIWTMFTVRETNKRIQDINKTRLNPRSCHRTIDTMGPITSAIASRSLWPVLLHKKMRTVTSICHLSLPLDLWNMRQ
jgi:hypothetical protein